ncbi:M20/M25/M40 family metallo-hydrolase [Paludibacter sp. 221]|uniref:M20 family metallo-hydrolase n=1 Tax=Paludibacter sp. 221 TaxID=2302939 RepID=UPI0013D89DE6|nr:M20 family metallo-hydrolase [Paludibacter sp. 221]NDV47072.1 M20/M25/M40 family metallo-hydrolase [Paludibacter sp. 221]
MFQEQANEAIELLQKLISIPSISREEKELADFLERYIEERGYIASRKGNNIWVIGPGFDTSRPTLLLNSHIDTVKPVAGWTYDPFKPVVEGDKLYGLGSNDAGASLVSLLHTFFYLAERNQPYNLIFAASAEEEVSGENGMRTLIHELPKIDFAIVGEPTGMQLAVAEKGLMVLDCYVYGKAGHAARNEGENAIYKAIPDIEWFKNYEFPKKSDLLGAVKMSVTIINAGTQHNVIPDVCSFVVDIRSNELYSNEELQREIDEKTKCEIKPRSTRLNSTQTPLNHPIVLRGKELGLSQFGSPTLSDQSLMNFASVKIGPGDSARSHTANEFIFLENIYHSLEIYIDLLDGLKI